MKGHSKSKSELLEEIESLRQRLSALEHAEAKRQRTKKKLREKKKTIRDNFHLLRAVLEGTDDAISVKDRDGRYLLVNTRKASILGTSVENLLGKPFSKVFPPDIADRIERCDRQIFETGCSMTLEMPFSSGHSPRVYLIRKVPYYNSRQQIIGVISNAHDISERKQREEALQYSRKQLRHLATRLAEVQEAERKNLVRELHDRVGQNLTALGLNISLIQSRLVSGNIEQSLDGLKDSRRIVDETTDVIRHMMTDLRPPVLDDYGLSEALKWYGDVFAKRTGLMISGPDTPESLGLSPLVETAFFRISQEALTNVAKHARATQVAIALQCHPHTISLQIRDNGIGFDAQTLEHSGWGLLAMEERAFAIGGVLHVESTPGEGTCICVEKERGQT